MRIKTTETKSKLALLIIVTMLLGIFSPAMAAGTDRAVGFTDIENHWAKDTIIKWTEEGLIKGYEDGKFKPDNNISRAEFMAVINRALGFNEEATIEFSDVGPDDWFYADVAKAVKAGYIEGYEDGSARPNQDISRQEAAVALSRALGIAGREQGSQFTDGADIADWSLPYINALTEEGYIEGYSDGSFQAQRFISRAEAVTMLDKARADIEEDTGGEESEPEEDGEDAEAPDSGGGSSSSGNGGSSGNGSSNGSSSGSVKVSAISVEGVPVVGQTLIAKTAPTNATGNYQWLKASATDGEYTKIAGATAKTYTLTNEDVGSYIKVTIKGTGSYKGTVTSNYFGEIVKPEKSTYKFTYEIPEGDVVADVRVELPVTTEYDILGKAGYDRVLIKFEGKSTEGDAKVTFKITEHSSGTEYTFVGSGQWGPSEGWPLPADFNSTNTWILIFPEADDYTISFWLEDLDADEEDKIIVEASEEVTVRDPEHSDYGFEIDEGVEILAVGNLPAGSSIPVNAQIGEPGDVPEEAKTALKNAFNGEGINLNAALVNVTFKALEPFKELGYEKVRILPLEVSGPDGGTLQAWMYAAVQDTAWFDLVQTGWGSKGTGFSQQADEASTMQTYVFANKAGTYTVTFKAVDTSKEDEPVIATGTAEVTVEISVSPLEQSSYAAGDELKFTISGLNPDEENVKVGMPINTGSGGWPWDSDQHVLTTNMQEVGDEGLYWVGTTNEYGKLFVSGTVGSELPNGELYITLPDYGYNIDKAIELQDEHGNGVHVGEPATP